MFFFLLTISSQPNGEKKTSHKVNRINLTKLPSAHTVPGGFSFFLTKIYKKLSAVWRFSVFPRLTFFFIYSISCCCFGLSPDIVSYRYTLKDATGQRTKKKCATTFSNNMRAVSVIPIMYQQKIKGKIYINRADILRRIDSFQ